VLLLLLQSPVAAPDVVVADGTGEGVGEAIATAVLSVTPSSLSQWNESVVHDNETVIYVDVRDTNQFVVRLKPKSGSVTADFETGPRRALQATFGPDAAQYLVPGVSLYPYSGFHYGTGSPEVLPLGVFPVMATDVGIRPDADVSVNSSDLWQWVQATTFLQPYTAKEGRYVRDILIDLVLGTNMWVRSQISSSITSLVKASTQTWDSSREDAIKDLCKACGAEAFVARDGRFILRDRKAVSTPVMTLTSGDGGRLIDAKVSMDISNVYNVVRIVPTVTDPAFALAGVTVRITDPTHPAYPTFYKVPTKVYRVDGAQFATTATQAQIRAAAQKILTKISAKAEQVAVVCMPDASLDEADTINVTLPSGVVKKGQIQQITYPLTTGDNQNITTVSTRSDEDFTP
jgi:hypothetical protein